MGAASLSPSRRTLFHSNITKLELEETIRNAKTEKPEFLVLQTVKKHYTRAVDFRTYRLANCSQKKRYRFKLYRQSGEKSKAAEVSALLWPEWPYIVHRISGNILTCLRHKQHSQKSSHAGTFYCVSETMANALSSWMCMDDHLLPFIACTRNETTKSRKPLRSYLDVMNYLLRKRATDQAIAKNDADIPGI